MGQKRVIAYFCYTLLLSIRNRQKVRRQEMKKQQNKTANKIVYIDRWLLLHGDNNQVDGVAASQKQNGRWVCKISLPLVNQDVKATSATEINAMLNASEKAYTALKKYLGEHPEVKFFKISDFRHYEIYTDERGYVGIQTNGEYRKKRGEEIAKMNAESLKALEKAITRIKKINGTDKDLFVQVMDKRFFREDDTLEEIQNKIADRLLNGNMNWFVSWQSTTIVGNCVVAIGYIMEMD